MSRAKCWCFTLFPNEKATIEEFEELLKNKKEIAFAAVGEEYAPETGKRHFQGYLRLNNKLRLNNVKSLLGDNTVHLELAKGTETQNIRYCLKMNNPTFPEKKSFVIGTDRNITITKPMNKEQKTRQLLKDLRNEPLSFIEENYPVEYFEKFNQIQRYRLEKDQGSETWNGNLPDKNFWIFGKTGTGKSTWARRQLNANGLPQNKNIYFKAQNKWWDGYMDQKIILIEDWNAGDNGGLSKGLLQYIKVWADRFTFNAEVKGASRAIHPGRFFLIVTSNHSIESAFKDCDSEDIDAIKRRFKEVEIISQQDIFLQTNLDEKILNKR